MNNIETKKVAVIVICLLVISLTGCSLIKNVIFKPPKKTEYSNKTTKEALKYFISAQQTSSQLSNYERQASLLAIKVSLLELDARRTPSREERKLIAIQATDYANQALKMAQNLNAEIDDLKEPVYKVKEYAGLAMAEASEVQKQTDGYIASTKRAREKGKESVEKARQGAVLADEKIRIATKKKENKSEDADEAMKIAKEYYYRAEKMLKESDKAEKESADVLENVKEKNLKSRTQIEEALEAGKAALFAEDLLNKAYKSLESAKKSAREARSDANGCWIAAMSV